MRSNIHSRDFSDRNLSDAVVNLFAGLESAGWKRRTPRQAISPQPSGVSFTEVLRVNSPQAYIENIATSLPKKKHPAERYKMWRGAYPMSLPKKGRGSPAPVLKIYQWGAKKQKTRLPFRLTGVKLRECKNTPLGCTKKLTRRRTCWQLSQADN